jgi:predicted ArsR family transcriptional regulator
MDDEVQREARALGDPTRHRLFRFILGAPDPVGVADLTEHVHLNHNAVRQHLAVLKEARLVVEDVEVRRRPGRPRLLYRLHPEAAGRWGTQGPYAWLARLLSDAVRNQVDPRQIGREDGHRRAGELAGGGDRLDLMEEEMTRRGFRPVRTQRPHQVHFVFQRCPFEDVALADPDTVCQLHLGQAEGLAEGLGGLKVDRLEAKDARRAGCRLVLRMDAEDTDDSSDRLETG